MREAAAEAECDRVPQQTVSQIVCWLQEEESEGKTECLCQQPLHFTLKADFSHFLYETFYTLFPTFGAT